MAPLGSFRLASCRSCGFSFNSAFESARMVYDGTYDNFVASDVFRAYYRTVACFLIERFALKGGRVYDIGCGKGEFLATLCQLAPTLRGIGIDPSCEPGSRGNLTLVRDIFRPGHFEMDGRLVVCRHVLEHLPKPVVFLADLAAAAPGAPLYVEVPSLEWIIERGAFWDFCYEHCNYFTRHSLERVLTRSGWHVEEVGTSFDSQYLWAIARASPVAGLHTHGSNLGEDDVSQVLAYAAREEARLEEMRARARATGGVALWGMATKGVMLSLLLAGEVLGGVDMNVRKQGHYAAGSGVRIHSPSWLETLPADVPILVTNSMYLEEVRAQAARVRKDLAVLPV
ncbi:MAG: class I SAM-dependent methyltransferase [Sphingomonadaceae bacterium]